MRKSIDVEAVTATLVNARRATLWRNTVEYLVKSVATVGVVYKGEYQRKLKEELEFAKANIELLSEEDYKWLLEQEKSPTTESNNGVIPSFNCKLCCDGHFSASDVQGKLKDELASAPIVCRTLDELFPTLSDVDKFKKTATKFTAASNTVKDTISKPKLGNKEASESRSTRWLVQITKGKDVYYRTLRTANRMSPNILDAKCYVSENAAKQAVVSVVAENADNERMYFWKIEVKEVLCTESSSRTVELVKPVVEAVEIPDDEKFVLWSNGSNEFFVQMDSTGIRTTKNIDEATKYVSYKGASQAVKKTDKEFPYRFSISAVKNVKSLVLPVEKSVTKEKVRARKPKVKEEWVLYTTDKNCTPYYYHGEIRIPTYQASMMLSMAKKFPSYGAATKAKCKLIGAGFITLEVANVEDCK